MSEGYPKEWRKGLIFPLRKKSSKDDEKLQRYYFANTAYKIYT